MSIDHVVNVTKSHGHRICLGIGLLEDSKRHENGLTKEVGQKLLKWVWLQKMKGRECKNIHPLNLSEFWEMPSLAQTFLDQKGQFGN